MEELKKKRTMAKAQFSRAENSLRKLLGNPMSLQETLERRAKDLAVKWQEVQNLHDEYVTTISEEEEAKEEEWIEELVDRFESIEMATDQNLRKLRKEEAASVAEAVQVVEPQKSIAEKSGVKFREVEARQI